MALTRQWADRLTRRRVWALSAVVVVAAAGTGTVWWYSGSDGRALDAACDGVLPVHEVRAVLGDGEVSVSNHTSGTFDGGRTALSVTCRVEAEGTVEVVIEGGPRPRQQYGLGDLYASVPASRALPVPLGHGWSGLFATDSTRLGDDKDGEATAAVLLDCAEGKAKGKSLLVTTRTRLGAATLDDPSARPGFVRTALATAKAANAHWGCGARLGGPVRSLGLPVSADEYKPLFDADGTCEKVPPGEKSAVSTVRETARNRAPREVCTVGTREGKPRYRLEASYGPYAEDARSQYARDYDYENVTPADKPSGRLGESAYWASAKCPGGVEPALYMVTVDGVDQDARRSPDLDYERAALKAFAKRSAEHHGCGTPVTP